MKELVVTETDEARLQATAQAVARIVGEQRKKETVQSVITALLGIVFVVAILALIALIPTNKEIPILVTYNTPLEEEEPKLEKKELSNNVQPRPPGASSSMARVIASSVPSDVSIPLPEITVPDAMIGMEDDFGAGFGSDEGDGSGGGGATFFGGKIRGKRIVYIVDFSGSMNGSSGGGSRIAALKKELSRSIKELTGNIEVSLVFFSSTAWTFDIQGPNPHDMGWSGVGKMPPVPWYPASPTVKQDLLSKLQSMPVGGGTMWYPPLKMALNMSPPPQGVFLLSDGAPRDADLVLDELKEINPNRVPIHTIALELPGSPAGQLMEIAENTGGKFSMVFKGKLYKGSSAEKFTHGKYDDD
ncbi:MAG: vWA domain-containing protein [Akkermansiaceae bacterium]